MCMKELISFAKTQSLNEQTNRKRLLLTVESKGNIYVWKGLNNIKSLFLLKGQDRRKKLPVLNVKQFDLLIISHLKPFEKDKNFEHFIVAANNNRFCLDKALYLKF